MRRHDRFIPMDNPHHELMDDLNEMIIRVKTYLFNIPIQKEKPTVQELDILQGRINDALKSVGRPLIKSKNEFLNTETVVEDSDNVAFKDLWKESYSNNAINESYDGIQIKNRLYQDDEL